MGKRKALDSHGSIDITGSVSCSTSQHQPEVIDLVEDSPPAPSGRELRGVEFDKTDAATENTEEQRKRIMAHASLVNSRKRSKFSIDPVIPARSPHRTKDGKAKPTSASEEEAAKQAIMQHAAQLAPTNSLLAQLHAERLARQQLAHPQQQDPQHDSIKQEAPHHISELRLLTYNVWFEEDVALQQRMSAIGEIIHEHDYPHFICFQEVTQNIYHLFQQSPWWHRYAASLPAPQPYFTALFYRKDTFKPNGSFQTHQFANSAMGRSILSIGGAVQGHKFRLATSHLESPCGHNQMFSKERVAQCKEGFTMLDVRDQTDVLWAGDMNWNTEDGDPPCPAGWVDAWSEQNPQDPGFTYDGKKNSMLGPYNRLRKRLDRVFCKTSKWKLESIRMVGMQALPGLTHTKLYKKGPTVLPILPSDHFGLVATFKAGA